MQKENKKIVFLIISGILSLTAQNPCKNFCKHIVLHNRIQELASLSKHSVVVEVCYTFPKYQLYKKYNSGGTTSSKLLYFCLSF